MKKYHLRLEQLECRDIPSVTAVLPVSLSAQVSNLNAQDTASARAIIIIGSIGNPNLPPVQVTGTQTQIGLTNPGVLQGFNPQPEPPGLVGLPSGELSAATH